MLAIFAVLMLCGQFICQESIASKDPPDYSVTVVGVYESHLRLPEELTRPHNLQPYTLHPTPYTLHPIPYTLHP